MRFARILAAAVLCGALVEPAAAWPAIDNAAPIPNFAEPAVSPDHAEVAFVYGGDIWSVATAGGEARVLVAAAGAASRPIFSPDGKWMAYVNTQPGSNGVWAIALDGGASRRLTHDDVLPELDGWSPDSRFVYFSSNAKNIGYFGDIFRVARSGGTAMRVVGERYVNAMQAAPSPDGQRLAYVRDGFIQWWRRGHSHIDQSEIVVAQPEAQRFEAVTSGEAKDRWPMWSRDGSTLYFISDRAGNDELWARRGGEFKQLTRVGGGPLLWPTISRDGRIIAFEHVGGIWTYDTSSGVAAPLPIALHGGAGGFAPPHIVATNRFSALALAPDAKKLAFVVHGRVFAAAAGDGSAQLITPRTDAADDLPVWSPDSRRLAYVVDHGTEQAVATADLPDGPEHVVTPSGHNDDYPHWSPDGKSLAFVRDGRELHVLDLRAHTDRILARGYMDRRPFGDLGDIAFSPAGDWIAYVDLAAGFSNVRVVPTAGGDARPISFLPNTNGGPLAWSPDGQRLYFVTSQRTENGAIAQIDLVPRAPRFREDAFRKLFDRAPSPDELPSRTTQTPAPAPRPSSSPVESAAPSPNTAQHATKIDFAGIRERLSFLATGLDVSAIRATPDGKNLVLTAAAARGENLYLFPVDDTSADSPVAKQLTSTPGHKTNVAVPGDGKAVYYLDAGTIFSVPLDDPKPRRLGISAEFYIDFGQEKRIVFAQAWSLLDRWYADPHFHGADWTALARTYAPRALAARTPYELRRVISLMMGELNSSHLAITGPSSPAVPRWITGRLGVQWDADEYARSGKLRAAEIVPLGPLALAEGVAVGDEILELDGARIDRADDIDALLANRIGKRTTLRIAPHGDAAAARTVVVLPVDTPAEKQLLYRAWVKGRRAYVEAHSGGRLGYVHLSDMSEESLARFYTDLDVQNREKAGVVIDLRNNTGGFVDPYALDVLTRREYVRFASRFGSDAPERTSLGQRALDRPSVLVVNAHSLSDAENFAEGYRELHAGPIVGEPTAGWIIFTSSATLADDSTLRLPSTSVFTRAGVNLELHPRPVDVRVANPPSAQARGADPQLDAAVRELFGVVANHRQR
jgi:tricorn protease